MLRLYMPMETILGSILMRIGDHLKNAPQEAYGIYRELSRVIDDITVGAAREASEKVLFRTTSSVQSLVAPGTK